MRTHYLSRVFGVVGHCIERGSSTEFSFAHVKSLFPVELATVGFHIAYLYIIKITFAVAVSPSNFISL